ncbi:MAG: hypothetical protein M3352_07320, partial [Bacteroidota bacterium]|nr:hypothetical protein [Bacteroidota bacterium]
LWKRLKSLKFYPLKHHPVEALTFMLIPIAFNCFYINKIETKLNLQKSTPTLSLLLRNYFSPFYSLV